MFSVNYLEKVFPKFYILLSVYIQAFCVSRSRISDKAFEICAKEYRIMYILYCAMTTRVLRARHKVTDYPSMTQRTHMWRMFPTISRLEFTETKKLKYAFS